ncbi:MAG TPA: SCO family protein [Polyangiales bacterium]|nr:SCO family protein [Polyangiales bacterium]
MKRALYTLLLWCAAASSSAADVKPLAADIDVTEHIGAQLPRDLRFTDQHGQAHRLSDLLQSGKPLLLSLAYYHCPGLCDISLRELASSLRALDWKLGDDYNALTISIDPHDTAEKAAAKRSSVMALLHANDRSVWPFAVADTASIEKLTSALGYRYAYDSPTQQYAHPAASIVLTPDGKVARYLYGPTLELRSVQLALREARLGRGGPTALLDRTIMSCFQYDPATRRYSLLILGVMRGGAALIALALALAILVFIRRGRLRRSTL